MRTSSIRARVVVATLGLGAAVVIVAMASHAPLSRATALNARAAQTPTTALFMVLAGMGVVMLAGLALLMWSGRRRDDDPPEREPTRIELHWFWKLVAVLVPLAVGAALVAAAVTGTRRVQSPRFGGQFFGGAHPRPTGSSGAGTGFVLPNWLPWTLLAILGIAVLAGGVVLWLRRWRPATAPVQSTATRVAVEAAIGALDADADPRRAVIAAYGAMQRALSERGVARSPAEAPREYLQRVLTIDHASEREARTLTGLFEEARYSTHAIPEHLRAVALSALRSLQRRIRANTAE